MVSYPSFRLDKICIFHSVKKHIYIVLTTLFLLLAVNVSGGTLFPFDFSELDLKVKTTHAFSPNQAYIFDIYFPVESGIIVSNTISDSIFHDGNDEQYYGGSSQKSIQKKETSFYFLSSNKWIPNSTVRKLLYPFHSFL